MGHSGFAANGELYERTPAGPGSRAGDGYSSTGYSARFKAAATELHGTSLNSDSLPGGG